MPDHPGRSRPVLAALGVCSTDEQLYRALLARPGATATELAGDTGWPTTRVTRCLRSLLDLGLASRAAGRPARYSPAVPGAALELLALRRQAAIAEARIAASAYAAVYRNPVVPFTVIHGAEAIAQRFRLAYDAVEAEVVLLVKPPYGVLASGPWPASYRLVYEAVALDGPAELAAARSLGGRVLRELPMPLLIADRRTGLVQTGAEELIEIGPSELLDGLLRLFDLLWDEATPLAGRSPLSASDQQLLALAAAGLTDQAIARRLGVAQRTVERRMQRILKDLGATTRFQAGVRAGQRGLVS